MVFALLQNKEGKEANKHKSGWTDPAQILLGTLQFTWSLGRFIIAQSFKPLKIH